MARPNILLLVLDSARADHLSCYGYFRKTTPNIDRMAQEGTTFFNHYSTANQTLPSHVSMFTGVHPFFHGAATNSCRYDGRYPTLQEILTQNEYEVIGASYNPIVSLHKGFNGFQRYHEIWKGDRPEGFRKKKKDKGYLRSLISQAQKYLKKQKWFNPVRKTARVLFFPYNKMRAYNESKRKLTRYTKGKGGEAVIRHIKEDIKRCKEAGRNFFIFANILEPHWPFLPPIAYRNLFLENKNLSQDKVISHNTSFSLLKRKYLRYNDIDWQTLNTLYDAEMAHSDALLGEVFSLLEAEGIMDETVVIVTSDHGELFGEHGLIGHGISLYEEVVKVPLIIRYPKRFKGGHSEYKLTQSIDFFPTILNLANAEANGTHFNYKGVNLCSDNLKEINDRFIIIDKLWARTHTSNELLDYANSIERAIIADNFKYVWGDSGKHRLHNIKEDPLEKKNLFSTAYKPLIDTLHSKMVNWYLDQLDPQKGFDPYQYDHVKAQDINALPPGEKKEELRKIEKMMKDLGYMD